MDKNWNKTLFVCGFVSLISGIIIVTLIILDKDTPSYVRMILGIVNIGLGCLFLGKSKTAGTDD